MPPGCVAGGRCLAVVNMKSRDAVALVQSPPLAAGASVLRQRRRHLAGRAARISGLTFLALKRRLYYAPSARYAYNRMRAHRVRRRAAVMFRNPSALARALYQRSTTGVVLHTNDGLQLAIRGNTWD